MFCPVRHAFFVSVCKREYLAGCVWLISVEVDSSASQLSSISRINWVVKRRESEAWMRREYHTNYALRNQRAVQSLGGGGYGHPHGKIDPIANGILVP